MKYRSIFLNRISALYMALILAFPCFMFWDSALPLRGLNCFYGILPECIFFPVEDFIAMKQVFLMQAAFYLVLLAGLWVVFLEVRRKPARWQRRVLFLMPLLVIAFMGSCELLLAPREAVQRILCRNDMNAILKQCMEYADRNHGQFPAIMPEPRGSLSWRYRSGNYLYYGKNRRHSEPSFILLSDKFRNHAGNLQHYGYSDGSLQTSIRGHGTDAKPSMPR